MAHSKTTFNQSRRAFLKSAAAGVSLPLFLPGLSRADAPSKKLNHASIGVDGMGWSDINSIASSPKVNIVAICDVDTARMERAAAKFPDARKYQHWEEMLEAEGDKIDSVNVTVPDHMHAPIAMEAMKRGKHVYCQKPLTHEVAEARELRKLREESGVVTQMGNQIQSSIGYRMAAQMIKDGVVGKVKEIHCWVGATFPQRGRPEGSDPVPQTLDWDKWIGVAPMRPYKNGIYHPFNWRGWIDFGGGPMGDFGCHILDTPFKALDLKAPLSVKAEVPKEWAENEAWNSENWPDWEIVDYVFPGNDLTAGRELLVKWYDGGKKPSRELAPFEDANRELPGAGALFIGEEGVLLLPHVGGPQLVPYSKNRGLTRPKIEPRDHYHSFVDTCLGEDHTTSHFTYAGLLTEATLLGNVASRLPGKTLKWDSEAMKVTNLPEANKYLSRKYRDGWKG